MEAFQLEEKKCKGPCGEFKNLEDFPTTKCNSDGRRNTCKKCHSKREVHRQMLKRYEANPLNYLGCNACDWFFVKSINNSPVRTTCPKCGSKDISE